jgi:hypothetical protein
MQYRIRSMLGIGALWQPVLYRKDYLNQLVIDVLDRPRKSLTSKIFGLSCEKSALSGISDRPGQFFNAKPFKGLPSPEYDLTMDAEDEFEIADFSDDEEVAGDDTGAKEAEAAADRVPVWRLIEMSRENRHLKMELADFEDYDDFEKAQGDYAVGLSH